MVIIYMKIKDIIIYITTELFSYYNYFKDIDLQIDDDIIYYMNNLLLSEYLKLYPNDNILSVDVLSTHPIGKRHELTNDIECIKLFSDIDDDLKWFISNQRINKLECIITINSNPFDGFEINHYSIINIFDNYFTNKQQTYKVLMKC